MERFKFLPGDLVLVNVPIPKRPSQCSEMIERGGFWPAKITRKLHNSKRQVICYGTQEEAKVPFQSMIAYNQQSRKGHLSHTRVVKDAVLAQALDEIESDFVAKTRTAEQLQLSGEAKLITSVVKSADLLEINRQDNTLRNLWNSYVEKTMGKISGICHLPRILIDFVTHHKETMSQDEIFKDFILHIFSLEEMGLISRFEVKNILVDFAALSFVGNNPEQRANNWPSVALESSSSASSIFLDDPASSVVIDSPYTHVDATVKDIIKSPKDTTTKVLKDASPDEVVEVPKDGNPTSFLYSTTPAVTNDRSDEVCATLDTAIESPSDSTNCVIENALPIVVSDCPSNSNTSLLQGTCPSVAIDCPDDVVIDTPPERAATDASTSLHVGMDQYTNVLNEAIPKCSLNQILEDSSSAVADGSFNASMTANASPIVTENYPLSLCTRLLENATSIDVLDYLVDTSINLLTGPIQTTSLYNDQTQNIDNPSETGLSASVEPATIASPCGDHLEQCWHGPKVDMRSMKETYEKVSRGSDKTVVEILEDDRSNHYNSAIEERKTSANIGGKEMCLDMVHNTAENIAIIGLERQVVATQGTQRNLDNCNKRDNGNEGDNEVEIIQVVGSATFMKELLFSNSKRKERKNSKRKRPIEKVKVNKKYVVHNNNTENVNGAHSNGRSFKQSNPQQPWQGRCTCCGSVINQSGSLNRDANGNNCTVNIIMNAQLSTESF